MYLILAINKYLDEKDNSNLNFILYLIKPQWMYDDIDLIYLLYINTFKDKHSCKVIKHDYDEDNQDELLFKSYDMYHDYDSDYDYYDI